MPAVELLYRLLPCFWGQWLATQGSLAALEFGFRRRNLDRIVAFAVEPNTAWDLAPDGKRVAVVTPAETSGTPRQDHDVVMLLNFFDELRRRASEQVSYVCNRCGGQYYAGTNTHNSGYDGA